MTVLSDKETHWLNFITRYVDNVFCYASSKDKESYLLADGFDIQSKDYVYWIGQDMRKVPVSNFASQQHFLRLLISMNIITQDAKYKQKAAQITQFFFDHFVDSKSHLFYWGGHRFINLESQKTEGPANKSQVHELKNHLPYYDFLYEVDKEQTLKYIKALWGAHVNDWDTLDFSRHGDYDKAFDPNVFLHAQKDVVDPNNWPNLPKTVGLTFINAATDLIYAAYKYTEYTNDQAAVSWAKHLYRQYILARCPMTGMPVYQYSLPLQRQPVPDNDNQTESWFGDRAARQFGPEFGEIAIEANVLFRDMTPMDMWPLLMDNPLAILTQMKKSPDPEVIQWTVSGLKNYYLRAYDPVSHTLKPMWGNGIDMTGFVFPRDGYYGKKGTVLNPIAMRPDYLFPLVLAWSLSRDNKLEHLIISMLSNFKLAKFEQQLSDLKNINIDSTLSSPNLIFALIELNLVLQHGELDELIMRLADNLFKQHTQDGFFVESSHHRFIRIDNIYPMALLAVIAYRQGKYSSLPLPISKGGYIHGEYLVDGKLETIYDINHIYQQLVY